MLVRFELDRIRQRGRPPGHTEPGWKGNRLRTVTVPAAGRWGSSDGVTSGTRTAERFT
jgi:hypothetical protein